MKNGKTWESRRRYFPKLSAAEMREPRFLMGADVAPEIGTDRSVGAVVETAAGDVVKAGENVSDRDVADSIRAFIERQERKMTGINYAPGGYRPFHDNMDFYRRKAGIMRPEDARKVLALPEPPPDDTEPPPPCCKRQRTRTDEHSLSCGKRREFNDPGRWERIGGISSAWWPETGIAATLDRGAVLYNEAEDAQRLCEDVGPSVWSARGWR